MVVARIDVRYVGLQGVPICLLWGLCMYYGDTWTLWIEGCL